MYSQLLLEDFEENLKTWIFSAKFCGSKDSGDNDVQWKCVIKS